jgi:hypothetical protein
MEQNISVLLSTAAKVSANANTLEAYFRSENLPEIGFGIDAPIEYDTIIKDPEVARARIDLINDAKKLFLLALGPVESFHLGIMSVRCDFVFFLDMGANVRKASSNDWSNICALSFQSPSNRAIEQRD